MSDVRLFNNDTVRDDDAGVTYTPFIGKYLNVGYHARHDDGREEWISLNASGGSDDDVPTVFVYIDSESEPTNAVHHYIMFDD